MSSRLRIFSSTSIVGREKILRKKSIDSGCPPWPHWPFLSTYCLKTDLSANVTDLEVYWLETRLELAFTESNFISVNTMLVAAIVQNID